MPKPVWGDPARYLGRVGADLGVTSACVALMTAVSLKQVVVLREEAPGVWLEGFFTVGVSNAVRAGEPIGTLQNQSGVVDPGTINIILITNARLAVSAMVGVVQVATESKTAALLSACIPSWTGQSGATGTGTDAVVVAGGRDGPALRYSGTHTKIGEMVGRLVNRGILEGLSRSRNWVAIGSAGNMLVHKQGSKRFSEKL
jgi:adenosylcobinamide hydrolase